MPRLHRPSLLLQVCVMSDTEPPRKCFCCHCNEYHSKTVYLVSAQKAGNPISGYQLKSSSSDEQDFRPTFTATSAVLTATDNEVTCHYVNETTVIRRV